MRAPSPTPESCRAPDPGGQGHYDGRCGAGGRSGAPPAAWLLCVLYVISILNVVPLKSLHYDTPTRVCLGHTADISHLLQFKFWERVLGSSLDLRSRVWAVGEIWRHAKKKVQGSK